MAEFGLGDESNVGPEFGAETFQGGFEVGQEDAVNSFENQQQAQEGSEQLGSPVQGGESSGIPVDYAENHSYTYFENEQQISNPDARFTGQDFQSGEFALGHGSDVDLFVNSSEDQTAGLSHNTELQRSQHSSEVLDDQQLFQQASDGDSREYDRNNLETNVQRTADINIESNFNDFSSEDNQASTLHSPVDQQSASTPTEQDQSQKSFEPSGNSFDMFEHQASSTSNFFMESQEGLVTQAGQNQEEITSALSSSVVEQSSATESSVESSRQALLPPSDHREFQSLSDFQESHAEYDHSSNPPPSDQDRTEDSDEAWNVQNDLSDGGKLNLLEQLSGESHQIPDGSTNELPASPSKVENESSNHGTHHDQGLSEENCTESVLDQAIIANQSFVDTNSGQQDFVHLSSANFGEGESSTMLMSPSRIPQTDVSSPIANALSEENLTRARQDFVEQEDADGDGEWEDIVEEKGTPLNQISFPKIEAHHEHHMDNTFGDDQYTGDGFEGVEVPNASAELPDIDVTEAPWSEKKEGRELSSKDIHLSEDQGCCSEDGSLKASPTNGLSQESPSLQQLELERTLLAPQADLTVDGRDTTTESDQENPIHQFFPDVAQQASAFDESFAGEIKQGEINLESQQETSANYSEYPPPQFQWSNPEVGNSPSVEVGHSLSTELESTQEIETAHPPSFFFHSHMHDDSELAPEHGKADAEFGLKSQTDETPGENSPQQDFERSNVALVSDSPSEKEDDVPPFEWGSTEETQDSVTQFEINETLGSGVSASVEQIEMARSPEVNQEEPLQSYNDLQMKWAETQGPEPENPSQIELREPQESWTNQTQPQESADLFSNSNWDSQSNVAKSLEFDHAPNEQSSPQVPPSLSPEKNLSPTQWSEQFSSTNNTNLDFREPAVESWTNQTHPQESADLFSNSNRDDSQSNVASTVEFDHAVHEQKSPQVPPLSPENNLSPTSSSEQVSFSRETNLNFPEPAVESWTDQTQPQASADRFLNSQFDDSHSNVANTVEFNHTVDEQSSPQVPPSSSPENNLSPTPQNEPVFSNGEEPVGVDAEQHLISSKGLFDEVPTSTAGWFDDGQRSAFGSNSPQNDLSSKGPFPSSTSPTPFNTNNLQTELGQNEAQDTNQTFHNSTASPLESALGELHIPGEEDDADIGASPSLFPSSPGAASPPLFGEVKIRSHHEGNSSTSSNPLSPASGTNSPPLFASPAHSPSHFGSSASPRTPPAADRLFGSEENDRSDPFSVPSGGNSGVDSAADLFSTSPSKVRRGSTNNDFFSNAPDQSSFHHGQHFPQDGQTQQQFQNVNQMSYGQPMFQSFPPVPSQGYPNDSYSQQEQQQSVSGFGDQRPRNSSLSSFGSSGAQGYSSDYSLPAGPQSYGSGNSLPVTQHSAVGSNPQQVMGRRSSLDRYPPPVPIHNQYPLPMETGLNAEASIIEQDPQYEANEGEAAFNMGDFSTEQAIQSEPAGTQLSTNEWSGGEGYSAEFPVDSYNDMSFGFNVPVGEGGGENGGYEKEPILSPRKEALLTGILPRRQSGTGYDGQNANMPGNPVIGLGNIQRGDGRPPHALISWGFGGRLVMMFPQQRMKFSAPAGHEESSSKLKSNDLRKGNIQIVNFRNLCSETMKEATNFPGPLVSPSPSNAQVSEAAVHKYLLDEASKCESKGVESTVDRAAEAVLWKMLLLMLKGSGDFQKQAVLKELQQILTDTEELGEDVKESVSCAALQRGSSLSEKDTATALIDIERLLLVGDREGAVVRAVESELWAQALIISNFVSVAAYRRVVERFMNSAMPKPSQSRILMMLFAGFAEKALETPPGADSIDVCSGVEGAELSGVDSENEDDELTFLASTWKKTLSSMLANRTPQDSEVIAALGDKLWEKLGSVRAAHCCFLAAGVPLNSTSGSRIVLVGGDHRAHGPQSAFVNQDTIRRTEVYVHAQERGNHQYRSEAFQPYRLVYAMWLADVGAVKEAFEWVKSVQEAVKSRSPSRKGSPRRTGSLPPAFHKQLKIFADRLLQCERAALGVQDSEPQQQGGWMPFSFGGIFSKRSKHHGTGQSSSSSVISSSSQRSTKSQSGNDAAGIQPGVGGPLPPLPNHSRERSTSGSYHQNTGMPPPNNSSEQHPPLPQPIQDFASERNMQPPHLPETHSPPDGGPEKPKVTEEKESGQVSPSGNGSKKKGGPGSKAGWFASGWVQSFKDKALHAFVPVGNATMAKTGTELEAYFDEAKNRWIFPGDTDQGNADAGPSAPPKMTEMRPSSAPPGNGEPGTPGASGVPMASGGAPPPMPQFSAGSGLRKGASRSRYVNTFANSGNVISRPDTAPGGGGFPPMPPMQGQGNQEDNGN